MSNPEQSIHKAIEALLQQIFQKHQIAVTDISIDWVNLGTISGNVQQSFIVRTEIKTQYRRDT